MKERNKNVPIKIKNYRLSANSRELRLFRK